MHETEREIAKALIAKTKAREISWEKTDVEDQLLLRTNSAAVVLDPGKNSYQMRVSTRDRSKVVTDIVASRETSNTYDFQLIRELYIEAVNSYYATERTLTSLLAELKG